jgi:anti-anti-sigma regulatory factor
VFRITKEQVGDTSLVRMFGTMDEDANLETELGNLVGNVTINCMEVKRINSIGIRAWVQFFGKAQSNGAKLKFVACSVVIIEQFNMISNFTCGGVVESFYGPFLCEDCGAENSLLFETDKLKKNFFEIPIPACSNCGKPCVFDSTPEVYFEFLRA